MRSLLFLLLFTSNICIIAREYSFEQLTSIHGLSQNNVLAICKDSDGYLWFGTYDGINRFDGIDFKTYKHTGDTNSLSDNLTRCIAEDHNNKLWIGTFSEGLCIFDRNTEEFSHIRNTRQNPNVITRNTVIHILCDSRGNIWASTHAGINVLQPKEDGSYHIIQITHDENNPSSLSENTVQSILEDSEGRIWVCSYASLDLMNMGENGEIRNDFYHISNPIEHWDIRNVLEIEEGFVFSFYTGIAYIDFNESSPEESIVTNYPGPPLYYMQLDSEGNIWSGGHNGIVRFEYSPKNDILFKHSEIEQRGEHEYSIHDLFIRTMLFDDAGIMWFGTNGEGVIKLNTRRMKFRHYRNSDEAGSISHNKVFTLYEDYNKNLWVGTEGGGLNFLSYKNKNDYKNGFISFDICPPGEQNFVMDITNVSSIDSSLIWAGVGYNRLLVNITRQNQNWIAEPLLPELTHQIMAVCKDEYETVWLGSYEGGLSKYHPNRKEEKLITYTPENSKLPTRIIRHIFEDSKGRLWISTDQGLLLIPREQKLNDTLNFTLFRHIQSDSTSISADYTVPIVETKNGEIWIGTFGNGINLYHEGTTSTNGYFSSIGTDEGLPNDMIKSIIEDDYGNLWVTSNKGLSKIDTGRNKIRNYTPSDGLQGLDFIDLSGIKRHDGEILIGGVRGFNAFFPEEIMQDTAPPIVVFNELEVMDIPVEINKPIDGNIILTRSLNTTHEIVLKHTQNNFRIYFSAIHYVVPKGNIYKYKLEGFDTKWTSTDSDLRIARYTNIDAGKYTFMVHAANSDGVWTEEPKKLAIWIKPPFWLTTWFRVSASLLVILFISGIVYFRFYLIQQRNLWLEQEVAKRTLELKQQKVDLELSNATKDKFFSIIAHDLKGPFSTMQGYLEMLLMRIDNYNKKQQKRKIEHALGASQSLYRLVQNLLQWSRIQRGLIPFKPIETNVTQEIEELIPIYVNMASEKGILLKYKDIDPNLSTLLDPDMFKTILRNLISNAIKFSNANDIIEIHASVNIRQGVPETLVSVSDTGVGIPKKAIESIFRIDSKYSTEGTNHEQGTGLGLMLCKEFVDFHRGEIWVESTLGEGTTFSFTIPFGLNASLSSRQ